MTRTVEETIHAPNAGTGRKAMTRIFRASRKNASMQAPTQACSAVTINKPVSEVYDFLHDFQNIPKYVRNIQSVELFGPAKYRWITRPVEGKSLEWSCEIIQEQPNHSFEWQSLPESETQLFGYVSLNEARGHRGTEVNMALEYIPPSGNAGKLFVQIFGPDSEQQLSGDLKRLKALLETGEIATIEGQPSGQISRNRSTEEHS